MNLNKNIKFYTNLSRFRLKYDQNSQLYVMHSCKTDDHILLLIPSLFGFWGCKRQKICFYSGFRIKYILIKLSASHDNLIWNSMCNMDSSVVFIFNYFCVSAETHNLQTLHTILSTGSPLKPQSYDFVYRCIKNNVLLGSISGKPNHVCRFYLLHTFYDYLAVNWIPSHKKYRKVLLGYRTDRTVRYFKIKLLKDVVKSLL